ncbi:MAG TPA: helix-turn-helix transcriptional regulator [Trebonia sp.]|nr:helix-turn-helix transcriptional regulator [Trebonia sp.]
MPSSGSPTVRRRRLAAELRKLRGNRKGGEVARGIGWSPTKISRAESGRESLPSAEIEKLIDYYGVTEPLRGRLLGLAEDAVQRGWWDDYADILTPQYLEFIGLEEEAVSCLHWQADLVPGLLQTEDYARQLNIAYQVVVPTIPHGFHERFLHVRMRRQERLTSEPVLRLSAVIDEAVLLRRIGNPAIMRSQLNHLADAAKLPNVDLRILPLNQHSGLVTGAFVIMRFGSQGTPDGILGDVVSTEALATENYVEGETDTHLYSIFFNSLQKAALSPADSRQLIASTIEHVWS